MAFRECRRERRIPVCLSDEEADYLASLSERTGRTQAELVRLALRRLRYTLGRMGGDLYALGAAGKLERPPRPPQRPPTSTTPAPLEFYQPKRKRTADGGR